MKNLDFNAFLTIRDAGRIDGISGVLLSGEPGTGKTRWAKLLAENWADRFIFYQCHEGTGADELLIDMNISGIIERLSPHSDGRTVEPFSKGLIPAACNFSRYGKVVLLFDEIDKARTAVDNFLLAFLQEAQVHVPHVGTFTANPQNLIFVATTNNARMLSEPLYRRLRRVNMMFPDKEKLFSIIKSLVPAEDFQAVGSSKVKFLIELALWYREQEVIKKVTPQELARLVSDLAVIDNSAAKVEALFTWFSPHESDWNILLKYNPGGAKYFRGMLK